MGPKLLGGILMAGFAVVELFMRRGEAAKRVRPTTIDRGTTLTIVVAYAFAVAAVTGNLLPAIALPMPVAWIGGALGILGFALRIWAMRVLGRFYTRTLVTTDDQRVVRDGPYRIVRHPGYLGSLLVWLGAAFCSTNLIAIGAVAVLLTVAYGYRIHVEERMLVASLGEPYVEYRRTTARLVPFVW